MEKRWGACYLLVHSFTSVLLSVACSMQQRSWDLSWTTCPPRTGEALPLRMGAIKCLYVLVARRPSQRLNRAQIVIEPVENLLHHVGTARRPQVTSVEDHMPLVLLGST